MRKKTFQIPVFTLIVAIVLLGAITKANSASGPAESHLAFDLSEISASTLNAQIQIVHSAISLRQQAKADAAFNRMITQFSNSEGLDEAVYQIGKDYQYLMWNNEKAYKAYTYNIEHFPDTKYGMLSHIEIIRSFLRSKTRKANAEVEKWMNVYTNQPDQAMGTYLIACAYIDINKEEKAGELFQFATEISRDYYGILSQIRLDAINRNFDAVNNAASYLIKEFPENDVVKQGISDLADYYRKKELSANAIDFYHTIIETWPENDNKVDSYKKMIYCYIDINDITIAGSLVAEIQEELDGDPRLARANYDIANYFLKSGYPENAIVLHQFNVENYSDISESILSQVEIVSYCIRMGDEESQAIEYEKMLSIYEDEETLPKEVCHVGDAYLEIDESEKARMFYQQVLDKWPGSEYVFNAKAGFIKANIHDDYDELAAAGIETLMEEYKDNYNLPRTVFSFGEQYWNTALSEKRKLPQGRTAIRYESDTEIVMYYYSKAASVWEIVINEFPESHSVYDAYKMAAEACRYGHQYEKAILYYRMFMKKWPDENRHEHSYFMLSSIYNAMLNNGSIPEDEAYELMKQNYEAMIRDFPDSSLSDHVYALIKEYETKHAPKKDTRTKEEMLAHIKTLTKQ